MFSAAGKSAVTSGYNINNSLRLRSSASAYLSRTPASAGNRRTWTLSMWFKLGALPTADNNLYRSSSDAAANQIWIYFNSSNSNALNFGIRISSTNYQLQIAPIHRDPSAWYHLVYAVDTTQATSSNRAKIYINGQQVTTFLSSSYPPQNSDTSTNNTGSHAFGSTVSGGGYFDGYMTEVNFIDGSALTPSSFGETDGTTGVWKPKRFGGSFGTNGFYLPFSDIATTSGSNAGLGKDFSGNANYWTTNNISVTSGATYDAMLDSPTNTSATVANYCVLNPLDNPSSSNSLANANLTPSTAGASGWNGIRSTIAFPTTGKWYYEVTLTSGTTNIFLGVVSKDASGVYHDHADTFAVRMSDCALRPSGSTATGTKASYAVGDIFGVAIDCSTPTVQFYKNGSLNVTYTSPTFDPTKTYFPCFMGNDTGASATHNYNFGQRPFSYTPPSGYVALNTFNLADSTIKKGNLHMDATAYTGTNGSPTTQVISSNFQPDLLWFKKRSASYDHALIDSVRGINKQLYSNLTNAEGTDGDVLAAIGSTSFTVGNSNYSNYGTLVAWTWKAGGTSTVNTSGTISSNVSVNTTAGFSVIGYTGTGSAGTIGHGLGVAPKMVIVKSRTTAGDEWCVWHTSLTNATYYLYLNSTATQAVDVNFWNSTAPSSTVVTLGSNVRTNRSGGSFICYAWAEIAGFSKFGSYTGNGSTDGTFVYTGFRPKYILIKRINLTEDWYIYDTSRITYNLGNIFIYADLTDAENTGATGIDILSNGFKQRQTGGGNNASGSTYIYAAYAENPFKNALAR